MSALWDHLPIAQLLAPDLALPPIPCEHKRKHFESRLDGLGEGQFEICLDCGNRKRVDPLSKIRFAPKGWATNA